MKEVTVRAGNTGILYLTYPNGKQDRYIPNYDLDQTRELLLEFQELRDGSGVPLKNSYWFEGRHWYPAMVSYLYWHVFFQYVKYEPMVREFLDLQVSFKFTNAGAFQNLLSILNGDALTLGLKTRLFYSLVRMNNAVTLRRFPHDFLFYRFGVNDFRSTEIRKLLDRHDVNTIDVLPPGRIIDVVRSVLAGNPRYFFGGTKVPGTPHRAYDLAKVDRFKRILYDRSMELVQATISGYLEEYHRHLRSLRRPNLKTFYGFDDANGHIFPVLYACRDLGMRTIAHQHGAYVRRHAAYVMEGIDKDSYEWFDKIIVWGDYWKQHLLKISNIYSPDMLIVGSNKLTWSYNSGASKRGKPKNILIPYEFLTNTYKVGRYIEKLLDLGYEIYFKPRPDEALEDQLEAYCLSAASRARLKVTTTLDEALIQQIDIIAGTMTTLIYELLPYGKIVWVFDIEYKHLEDLVEEGYAHKIDASMLDDLPQECFTPTCIDKGFLFHDETLEETLMKHVIMQH